VVEQVRDVVEPTGIEEQDLFLSAIAASSSEAIA